MDAERRLDRIENRLDAIDANLERHMKRSDSLEEIVKPVQIMMIEMTGIVKLLKFIALIVSILEALRFLKVM